MNKIYIIALCIIHANGFYAQSDTLKKISFSGYTEFYWAHQFDKTSTNQRPEYIYNHNTLDAFNLNLGFVKAAYNDSKIRSNVALMVGQYAQYNLAEEPTWASFIYEANAGVRLWKNNVWLDVGILPSHIGFESALGFDNQTLTRSLLAENSPYFETGARISYQDNAQKFYVAGFLLNGWQNIEKKDDDRISYGTQLTYKPTEKFTINYSNFIGKIGILDILSRRVFHNFYLQYFSNEFIDVTFGLDYGTENNLLSNKNYNWFGLACITGIKIDQSQKVTLRYERYDDKNNVLINPILYNSFFSYGLSFNYDYLITTNAKIRFEYRNLTTDHNDIGSFLPIKTKYHGITIAICAKF